MAQRGHRQAPRQHGHHANSTSDDLTQEVYPRAWTALPAWRAEASARTWLQHLDFDRRTAFVLTQLLGLSYSQAAEVCGCPGGTLRSRVARARTDLLDWLDGPEARASEQSAMREH